MGDAVSRRRFLVSSAAVPFAAAAGFGVERAEAADGGTLAAFPSHPPELVKETVIVAHGNVRRLREIVDERPALARAAWDWGFGDWEDALGAASHVGNREIAEYLIAHGARPTLFSATMLGQLD